jgi:5-methylcytosine-specific restriction endonuclease McrA
MAAADPGAVRDRSARYREANRAAALEANRAWKRKPDRPCRFAAAGCLNLAAVGQILCPGHELSESARRQAEKAAGFIRWLAEDQHFLCAECSEPLPRDLKGVEADHIVPYSSGLIIHDYWNRQAIHLVCNRRKNARCTPADYQRALARYMELAA